MNCRRSADSSHCRSDKTFGLGSFDDIVSTFITNNRHRTKRELQFYIDQSDLDQAIKVAARCISPDGKRHSHQRRIPAQTLAEMQRAIRSANLLSATSFSELHDCVENATKSIWGIGELTVYDVAHRIGAYLGIRPEYVYLHAGTCEGACALGLRGKALSKNAFPNAFQRLTAAEIEDCLCIYKDAIRRITK